MQKLKSFLLLFLVCVLGGSALAASPAATSPSTDLDNARTAYNDFIRAFWYGPITNGHFLGRAAGTPDASQGFAAYPKSKGYLWGYAHSINVLYSWWKFAPSSEKADAAARIKTTWNWLQNHWTIADLGACGNGTMSVALDDATWTAMGLLEIADVTHDPKALAYAKAILDGAWNHWHDDVTGGGLWYRDVRELKNNYQATYAFASYFYYQLSGDPVYQQRAVSLDDWAAAVLLRNGQTVAGHLYPRDGLYWMAVDSTGLATAWKSPYQIAMTASAVMIEAQMAFAALDARLYAATGNPLYQKRVQLIVDGIKNYERVKGTDIYLNDRDGYVDGFAATFFAQDVVQAPNLLTPQQAADHKSYLMATARSIMQNDRADNGTYGADWQGPVNGVWDRHGLKAENMLISAQAVNLVIAGYVASH